MDLEKLGDLLTLLKNYPEVKTLKYNTLHLELSRSPVVQETKLPTEADNMPPDSVMLFASTPTFDEMMGDKEHGD